MPMSSEELVEFEDLKKLTQENSDKLAMHQHRAYDGTSKLFRAEFSRASFIDDITLGDGINKSGRMALKLAPTKGDTFIKGGTITDGDFDNSDGNSGFIMGLDDSDSDLPKFFFGSSTENLEYDGTNLKSDGIVLDSKGSFGGDGADGALNTSSGAVDIDFSSANVVTKNFTSINVTTNNLTTSNPASGGSFLILKSQGDVTISASVVFSASGGAGGAGGTGDAAGSVGTLGFGSDYDLDTADGASINHYGSGGGSNGGAGGAGGSRSTSNAIWVKEPQQKRFVMLVCGSGGGGGGDGNQTQGGSSGGAGGKGGGAILIECGGALNFTGTITVAGANGSVGIASANDNGGGGGGGGGGTIFILHNTLTANSGTLTVSKGSGGAGVDTGSSGTGGSGGGGGASATTAGVTGSTATTKTGVAGGDGADGFSLVEENKVFA